MYDASSRISGLSLPCNPMRPWRKRNILKILTSGELDNRALGASWITHCVVPGALVWEPLLQHPGNDTLS
eukprot:4854934-Karenia_brevis.AAC.1